MKTLEDFLKHHAELDSQGNCIYGILDYQCGDCLAPIYVIWLKDNERLLACQCRTLIIPKAMMPNSKEWLLLFKNRELT
jgi:hypothetical protein